MSFSKTFFPVTVTVLIALIAIIISLAVTDRAIKKSNHKQSHYSMVLHFRHMQDFQETMVLDYTEWSVAFEKLTMQNDLAWFGYSIGGANMLQKNIHGLAFIKNDGTLVAQHTRNQNIDFAISREIFTRGFDLIRLKTLQNADLKAKGYSFFIMIKGTPALISLSPLTHPERGIHPDFHPDQRDFLAFWTILTPETLSQTSGPLKLNNLTITSEPSANGFSLRDSRGTVISSLTWSLQTEDHNPLTLSLITSLAMFGLLLFGGFYAYRRILDLVSEVDQARELAETGHQIKSDFLATMSHELRTPLNSIIGFSDILTSEATEPLSDKQSEYVGHIQSSGKHLLTIINEILDMSKIEAGKYELYEVEINLRHTLHQSIIYLEKEADDKNITIVKRIPEILNEFNGDEKVLRQLILNLLSNAIKFTLEGGQVIIGCSVTNEGCMEIFIEDNGIGISPDKIDLITEAYQQDQDHKTRSHQGTGLGLAISKAFVEMHQGTLNIKSTLDVGTRVTLTFPPERVLAEMI